MMNPHIWNARASQVSSRIYKPTICSWFLSDLQFYCCRITTEHKRTDSWTVDKLTSSISFHYCFLFWIFFQQNSAAGVNESTVKLSIHLFFSVDSTITKIRNRFWNGVKYLCNEMEWSNCSEIEANRSKLNCNFCIIHRRWLHLLLDA